MKQLRKLLKTTSFLVIAFFQRRASIVIKVNDEELKQRLICLTYHILQVKGTQSPFNEECYQNTVLTRKFFKHGTEFFLLLRSSICR